MAIIGLDFDGTCVADAYPQIGPEINAVEVIKELEARGHRIILWTVRTGRELAEAVGWFKTHGIKLTAVNANLPETDYGRKIYTDYFIDDKALGTPLRRPYPPSLGKPFVDWSKMRVLLVEAGLI